jgi:3-hydroxyisobutyrate dehydrogenase-like beta-hydroxyacid dehydrogenase
VKRVGIIGVGDMGLEMAKNLLKNGYELTAYDVRDEPLEELAQMGARIAASPKEVGAGSDYVFIMVLSGVQAKEVVFGEAGLLKGLAPGSTIICTASIGRADMVEIAVAASSQGIHVIDSPVSGSTPRAEAATLSMMVAAEKDIFDRGRAILEAVGKDIHHVGEEPGMGQTVKTAAQVLVGATFAAVCESLVLGAKAGVKPEVMCEIFSTNIAASFLARHATERIMERNFRAGSRIGTTHKDLGLALDLAKDLGVPMFVTGAVYELFHAGITMNPDEDNHTIVKLLEHVAGVKVEAADV